MELHRDDSTLYPAFGSWPIQTVCQFTPPCSPGEHSCAWRVRDGWDSGSTSFPTLGYIKGGQTTVPPVPANPGENRSRHCPGGLGAQFPTVMNTPLCVWVPPRLATTAWSPLAKAGTVTRRSGGDGGPSEDSQTADLERGFSPVIQRTPCQKPPNEFWRPPAPVVVPEGVGSKGTLPGVARTAARAPSGKLASVCAVIQGPPCVGWRTRKVTFPNLLLAWPHTTRDLKGTCPRVR